MAVSNTVYSRSLLLLSKLGHRLDLIDQDKFPTKSTLDALHLTKKVLNLLYLAPFEWKPSPKVFHQHVLLLERLCGYIERSTLRKISWPVVSYCNDIWNRLFYETNYKVFFSYGPEYNYVIRNYTMLITLVLRDVVPEAQYKDIIDSNIYCLSLASLEEDNIPLYANIAHEFGHALFRSHHNKVAADWSIDLDNVLDRLMITVKSVLPKKKKIALPRIKTRLSAIIIKLAEELISDLIANMLVGQSFYFSLSEMLWPGDKNTWFVDLSNDLQNIKAHPSANFRLNMAWKYISMENFLETAVSELGFFGTEKNWNVHDNIISLKSNLNSQKIELRPRTDSDAELITTTIKTNIKPIMEILDKFIEHFLSYVNNNNILLAFVPELRHVGQLLLRLENGITPNIIQDGTLLGKPANFENILLAASLYRLFLLETSRLDNINDIKRLKVGLERVQRLTVKAFETSYIQRQYNIWIKKEEE